MAYEKLVLAAALEPCELGQEFEKLPPHLTIVPPFDLAKNNLTQLHEKFQDRVEENPRLRLIGGSRAYYGPNGEILVRQVAGIMFGLHAACMAVVKHLGGRFDATYTELAWSPHVSDVGAVAKDQDVYLDEVQLFKYVEPNAKIVEAIYGSGGARING